MIQTKEIKKYGNSLVITISPADARIMGLKAGDIIQVEILKEVQQLNPRSPLASQEE